MPGAYQQTADARVAPLHPSASLVRSFRRTVFRSALLGQHGILGEKQIAAISQALTLRLLETCQLDVNSLVFDCTNFDTFIDTENPSRLPQRGHAKSKRSDLRIVGLALLVSIDFHVPLLWKVYPGNQHDSVTFVQVLQELTQRYQALARDCQSITLVFDKGNNSARNQELLDG